MPEPDAVARVPAGWRLQLDGAVRRLQRGAVLAGGTPLRYLRLTDAGVQLVERWSAGTPVGGGAAEQALAARLVAAGIAHPAPPPAPVRYASVAVVVPVRDDVAGLAAVLDAVAGIVPVTVVDDGSADAEAVTALASRHGAHVVRHPAARGPAAARNTGWRATDADTIMFLDADVVPADGCLELLLGHLGDPAVGAVAPRVRARLSDPPGVRDRYERARFPLDLGADPGAAQPAGRLRYVPSTALAVRRTALQAVGGFDERLRYGEDVDLVWRLHAGGWAVRYEPGAQATHPPRASWAGWARQRWTYGTSAAPLARRHPGALAPVQTSWPVALAWAGALAGRPVISVGAVAGATAAVARRLRPLGQPWPEAARLAGGGTLRTGEALATAARRAWLPLVLAAATRSRRARAVAALCAVVGPAVEHRRSRPDVPLPGWLALRLADDAAYCAGVWAGCVRERTIDPLVPRRPPGAAA